MKHLTKDQPTTNASERSNDHQLTAEQVDQIKRFIEEAGGIENARQALVALAELQKAA